MPRIVIRSLAVSLTLLAAQLPMPAAAAAQLPAGARARAEWLVRQRLPCLGCHELNGEGGRIGPSLTGVGGRLTGRQILLKITGPERVTPGSIMPRVPMTPETAGLLAGYLSGENVEAPPVPVELTPAARPDTAAPALYHRFCAPCHGERGAGDGPNAQHLPVPPTRHSDDAYMSRRPDDALYDAIAAGGWVMGKSSRMPPFGRTLTPGQIRSLVRHLRTLCRCEGPAWSRDGG